MKTISQEQLLKVSFTEEDPIADLLPRSLLLSDHSLGWDGSCVKHCYEPVWEMPEINSLTVALAVYLIRRSSKTPPKIPTVGDGLSRNALEKALNYINTHLDGEVTLSKLAEVVGMSQYYFCRLFKQSMGISPYQYLLQQRVERAKQLLEQRKFSIADIALQCGFSNQSHLNRHFKRIVGMTPFMFLKQ
ncbi:MULTISPECIES: helix-turn-helix domain-containing protein [Nostocales]|uniref:Helix-turn-helix transcriptional regulator n=3 Tax=Nostocales TaxID=1161 RepID=A0A8S9SYX7_9CYAN|nr:AraC family transcriptional regulator [Tolypothrix bouteillei]KAF3885046.1 helix-turn-helix transcriptional regulator [Tolypothrix bouteillei VB521301]